MERETSSPQNGGQAYSITAPALHAANVIARNYAFRPQPGQRIEPTTENVARLIDYSTRLPQTLPVMDWFTREHPWYDSKPARSRSGAEYIDEFLDWIGESKTNGVMRLADNLERLRHGIRQIEVAYEKMPRSAQKGIPCGAAWNAAKNLCKIFEFQQKWRLKWSEKNLALLIDTSANLFRVEASMEKLLTRSGWLDRQELSQNVELARQGMRIVELVNNSLPTMADRDQKYTVMDAGRVEHKPRYSQRELDDARSQLQNAVTPQQEQKILKDWRIHNHGNS